VAAEPIDRRKAHYVVTAHRREAVALLLIAFGATPADLWTCRAVR
jgi:hypothetical protein